MNCRDIEPLLLAERDGVLSTEQHATLGQLSRSVRPVSKCVPGSPKRWLLSEPTPRP